MFSNIGTKIKGLAIGTFIVEALASVITGFCFLIDWGDFEGFMLFLGIAVGGSLVAWMSSWLIYGFGQLIDNTEDTVAQLRSIDRKLDRGFSGSTNTQNHSSNNNSTKSSSIFKDAPRNYSHGSSTQRNASTTWTCKACGKVNYNYVGTCGCGQSKADN